MKQLRFLVPINLRAGRGGPRRFKILAYSGGLLPVEGFEHPVVVDLNGLKAGAVPIVLNHRVETDSTVGEATNIVNTGRNLSLAGQVTGQSQQVLDVLSQADAGHRWQASIGCLVHSTQDIPAGEVVTVNGQQFRGPVIIARRSTLRETSVLPVGADSHTSVNLAASAKGKQMDFEQWAADKGFETANLSPDAKAFLTSLFDAEMNSTPGTPPSATGASTTASALIDLRATRAADHVRIAEIERVATRHPLVAATAIRDGWTPEKTELAILKASHRMNAPSNISRHNTGSDGTSSQHLSAALMVKAGYSTAAEKMFGATVMEQSKQLHASSLVDLCRAALTIDGRECPRERNAMLRAALSTGSMPVALGDSANKTLEVAYRQAPASWRSFAAVKPAANFKTQTGIRPTFGGELEQLPKGGLIKHGTFAEETYEWHVDTFARQLQVDRRDFLNDDASVFSDVIPGLARAAARSLSNLVGTTLLANANSFFGTGHANYFNGASPNLQASSLATAIQMLRQMKDAEGNLLDLQPSVLLVPPELEQVGLALLKSTEVARVATGDQLPTGNTFKDIAKIAVEPRLSDAGFTGYSLTHWYLFSDPMNASVIVGFLDGNEAPTLETFGLDSDINKLAFGFRVFHDFGCALADFRAAIRSKGSA